jgi:hypothetical protein
MPGDLVNLLNLLLALVPVLVFVIAIIGIALLAFLGFSLLIRKSGSISKQVTRDLNGPPDHFFTETTPHLLRWENKAPADLSAFLEFSRHTTPGNIHACGKVMSLSKPDAPGWLAYDLLIEKRKGALVLKSSDCNWRLGFLSLISKETPVEVDGRALGTIRQERNEILLLSPSGTPVGKYLQHQFIGSSFGLSKYAQTPYFGAVELNGHLLGEVNRNPILLKQLVGNPKAHPLVKNLAGELSREDEQWLVALVGWEIMYRIVLM